MVALRKVFVLAAIASLAGCASTSNMMHADGRGSMRTDADYVYAVESIAHQKGVDVVWINPPHEEGVDYARRVR